MEAGMKNSLELPIRNAPTLFDVPAITEVITAAATTVTYEKISNHLQSNHKGRNSFPKTLPREEQILYPAGIDLATAKKMGEDVTETLAFKHRELFVKKLVMSKICRQGG